MVVEVEAIVEPDDIGDDVRRELVALVGGHRLSCISSDQNWQLNLSVR